MPGELVREIRRRLGLTQHALGDFIGVDQGTVSRWERGMETPRPASMATLQSLLRADEESRALRRSLAMVRQDLRPSTLLNSDLKLAEISASGARHFRARSEDPQALVGLTIEEWTERCGVPQFLSCLKESGVLIGDALVYRFAWNFYGMGHTTVYEPLTEKGRLVGIVDYATRYFAFPQNTEVTFERAESMRIDTLDEFTLLHEGARPTDLTMTAGGTKGGIPGVARSGPIGSGVGRAGTGGDLNILSANANPNLREVFMIGFDRPGIFKSITIHIPAYADPAVSNPRLNVRGDLVGGGTDGGLSVSAADPRH